MPPGPGRAVVAAGLDGSPAIATLPNLRDLGGLPTRDGGRVRRGLAWRSTDLGRLDGDDAAAFARLGIRTVVDLRTARERDERPDRLPGGTSYVVADVLADSTRLTPADFGAIFDDPRRAAQVLGGGAAERFFVDAYREFVTLPSARAAYGRLFAALAAAPERPVLFHCTTGKDRTGWGAAALLLLLDVPAEAVMEEYLLSGPQILPMARPFFDLFAARGGDVELLRPLMDVRPVYLEAALEEVSREFGSIEAYGRDGLGLAETTVRALREELVERT